MTGPYTGPAANERLKQSFTDWFWWGTTLAVIAHFLLFAFFPEMRALDVSFGERPLNAIDLPPDEVEVPPAPEPIARPATPVISARADLSDEVTIAPTTFEGNPIEELPELAPPPEADDALAHYQAFSPSMIRPDVRNRGEVARRMRALYPSVLRDAGIGGTTTLHLWLDEEGRVRRAGVARSSGHPQLDQAALEVIAMVEFTPAMNRDRRVPVLIQWPITWRAR